MSLAALLIRTIYGRQDTAPRPPAAPQATTSPTPTPESHPHAPAPSEAVSGPLPTDRPLPGVPLPRWHADEAERLALLADLTRTRSPWDAAQHMNWST